MESRNYQAAITTIALSRQFAHFTGIGQVLASRLYPRLAR